MFERILQNEYNLHDKYERHTAYTSFLVLGLAIGAIGVKVIELILTLLGFI